MFDPNKEITVTVRRERTGTRTPAEPVYVQTFRGQMPETVYEDVCRTVGDLSSTLWPGWRIIIQRSDDRDGPTVALVHARELDGLREAHDALVRAANDLLDARRAGRQPPVRCWVALKNAAARVEGGAS